MRLCTELRSNTVPAGRKLSIFAKEWKKKNTNLPYSRFRYYHRHRFLTYSYLNVAFNTPLEEVIGHRATDCCILLGEHILYYRRLLLHIAPVRTREAYNNAE